MMPSYVNQSKDEVPWQEKVRILLTQEAPKVGVRPRLSGQAQSRVITGFRRCLSLVIGTMIGRRKMGNTKHKPLSPDPLPRNPGDLIPIVRDVEPKATTLFAMAQPPEDTQAKPEIIRNPSARYPAGPPSHADPVGLEPPLGFQIDGPNSQVPAPAGDAPQAPAEQRSKLDQLRFEYARAELEQRQMGGNWSPRMEQLEDRKMAILEEIAKHEKGLETAHS